MYYPILRGKQNEFLALKDIINKLSSSKKVIPVIEPVNTNIKSLLSCLNDLEAKEVTSIIIVNPTNGDLAGDDRSTESLINSIVTNFKLVKFGIIIRSTTTLAKINYYLNLLQDFDFILFHQSPYQNINELKQIEELKNFYGHLINNASVPRNYHKNFSINHQIVVIDDPFNKQQRNEDYRLNQNEFFSDMHTNYHNLGFNGFGDYLIIGEEYRDGGRLPQTVALHITYPKDGDEIWIKHFLSQHYPFDPKTSAMVLESINELKEFLEENPYILEFSSSCRELLTKGSTSLGTLKRHSIAHHIELIIFLFK
ncbi:sce7725 family protein [Acinetobacter baumannii]